ncbi:MAG: porin family protein [Candidatus Kapaibacterium sp.]|nr:porin family protein [Candidatus Kapabacteria bacterium]
MKKLFILLLLTITPMALFANFNAGINIGYSATQLKTDLEDINSNLKSGFQIGVFARFGDKFFLQPELNYASRGGFAEFQDELLDQFKTTGTGTEIHTGMFQLPIMLGVKLLDGDMLGMNIQAGPVLSLISNKGLAGVEDVFNTNDFEDFTWGIQVGAGIDIMSFILNVRYEYALSDIYKGSVDNMNANTRANTFLVTLGWKLL